MVMKQWPCFFKKSLREKIIWLLLSPYERFLIKEALTESATRKKISIGETLQDDAKKCFEMRQMFTPTNFEEY